MLCYAIAIIPQLYLADHMLCLECVADYYIMIVWLEAIAHYCITSVDMEAMTNCYIWMSCPESVYIISPPVLESYIVSRWCLEDTWLTKYGVCCHVRWQVVILVLLMKDFGQDNMKSTLPSTFKIFQTYISKNSLETSGERSDTVMKGWDWRMNTPKI